MKVYVVFEFYEWEGSFFVSVHATHERAEEQIKKIVEQRIIEFNGYNESRVKAKVKPIKLPKKRIKEWTDSYSIVEYTIEPDEFLNQALPCETGQGGVTG